jgi:hypothetical protein
MNVVRRIGFGLFLAATLIAATFINTSGTAPPAIDDSPDQDLPPVVFADDAFPLLPFWVITEEITGEGSFTAEQRSAGGNPGAFRFMSHRLPPVAGEELGVVSVTHIYHHRYDPRFEGEIRAIDYQEDGIILSFPFPEAFSTTQPVVEQDGRIFRSSTKFIRFTAQNSSHAWETKTLFQLTAADFAAVDGSGDHPDFSSRGGPLRVGFTRTNSRGSTLPPVPADEDMIVDQGVDNWQVTIYRDNTNRPPQTTDDVFVLNGHERSLPLTSFFDVLSNDTDPNYDRLEITAVGEPLYGRAGTISSGSNTVYYALEEARTSDQFIYTVSDGALSSSAEVQVYVDCVCTVTCLSSIRPIEPAVAVVTDTVDLPLIYRVRDQVLKPTADGRRYVDMYYATNPEILVNIVTNETLRNEALATVTLLQPALSSLVDGDGSAVITQAQVEALKSFLGHLLTISSQELQQLIFVELLRLGSLDEYVGLTVKEAKRRAIGDATVHLPLVNSRQ